MTISNVQLKGNLYTVIDNNGKRVKDMAASVVGTLCGFGSDFIVFRHGNLYGIYAEDGRKIKDLAVSVVGDFKNASGDTIVFRNGSLLDSYDRNGILREALD
jgi:hypothetical protein